MPNDYRKGLPDPLPPTASIPATGWHFFRTKPPASYRLAKRKIIPVLETGSRNMVALPRVLAARLNRDPQDAT
jgi:hypothetical protein